MLDENGCYDPNHGSNPIQASLVDSPNQSVTYNDHSNGLDDGNIKLPTFSLEDLSHHDNLPSEDAAPEIGLDHLQHPIIFDLDQELQSNIIEEGPPPPVESNRWEPSMQHIQESFTMNHHRIIYEDQQQGVAEEDLQNYAIPYPDPPYAVAPDLFNILQLPACTVAPTMFPPTASISFGNPSLQPASFSFDVYNNDVPASHDSTQQMGYPPPPPPPPPPQSRLLKDLFSSLPQNYGLFCGVDEREAMVGGAIGGGNVFQEMDLRRYDGIGLDYDRREMGGLGKGEGKTSFATERQRREQLNEKYKALRLLIPNPTKADRASIVGDAIEHIKELVRTVEELKVLVEKKRHGRERRKILKMEDEATADMESSSIRPLSVERDDPLSGGLRSSWLQRRYKDGAVDVRIIDDEVNIKLTQKKKPNCLLDAAKALDELHLDLTHVAGGNVGDHHVYMFNTKISEGSSVYAGAVANKFLRVLEGQYGNQPCPVAF
ncbi:hypothetical protein C4D60_Mb06t02680 [Musa balbisiana]|uniref:BHLH domain-containing protein n=1 Tax=Musa balbisiana TaxID=52838 RepID=A0A4V4H3M1_MUSBA|nr:hypothetical protein C4D60_Mb06t02680 [Musa balbisiana]